MLSAGTAPFNMPLPSNSRQFVENPEAFDLVQAVKPESKASESWNVGTGVALEPYSEL